MIAGARTADTARTADLVASAAEALAASGVQHARLNAEWLLAAVLGSGRFDAYIATEPLGPDVVATFGSLVDRRAAGEPLQQLLGWEAFRGLRFRVTRDVLVPRPETEVLVEWALERLPRGAATVIDVGTGSGCIACAIAHERPDARVLALDVSAAAAHVARDNAAVLGVAGRVGVVVADLLEAVRRASADMIVANPPYLPDSLLSAVPVEVREWEPHVALVGGEDGLSVVRPLIAGSARALRPGGALVLETAGAEQAAHVATMLRDAGWESVATRADLTGTVRLVAAEWRGAPITAAPAAAVH